MLFGISVLNNSARVFEPKRAPNKSLDVRAKQRLCYQTCPLNFTLSLAVSPHVNSIVIPLRFLKTINVQRSLVIDLGGTSMASRAASGLIRA
jgi:hypothetical protein